MNKIIVLCGLVLLLSGCHNYSSNVGETLGCVLAGNGCDDGRTGATGAAGSNGLNGANGADGASSSCTVQSVLPGTAAPNGGARIACTDGSDALILNGAPGAAGSPGVNSIMQVIKLCPNIAGSHPEVLLVLSDRTLLASVSANQAGSSTRLSIVNEGTGYATTDGRPCTFNVSATEVSWPGGSATY